MWVLACNRGNCPRPLSRHQERHDNLCLDFTNPSTSFVKSRRKSQWRRCCAVIAPPSLRYRTLESFYRLSRSFCSKGNRIRLHALLTPLHCESKAVHVGSKLSFRLVIRCVRFRFTFGFRSDEDALLLCPPVCQSEFIIPRGKSKQTDWACLRGTVRLRLGFRSNVNSPAHRFDSLLPCDGLCFKRGVSSDQSRNNLPRSPTALFFAENFRLRQGGKKNFFRVDFIHTEKRHCVLSLKDGRIFQTSRKE